MNNFYSTSIILLKLFKNENRLRFYYTIKSQIRCKQKSVRLNVNRSLSRLKSIFVTLIAPPIRSADASTYAVFLRFWNFFYGPMHYAARTTNNN